MFSYKKLPIKNFFASICLHVLLLAGFIFYMNLSPLEVKTGENELKIVNSYLYQDNQLRTIYTQKKSVHVAKETKAIENKFDTTSSISEASNIPKQMQLPLSEAQPSNKNNPIKKVMAEPPIKQAASSQARSQSQSSSGEQIKGLIAVLHLAIQKQQQYPPSALRMNRQGKVTVSFMLSPNGSISDLRMVKSSGVKSLDEAALAAVNLAAPFSGVDVYLKTSQTFNIDVVFALEENE